MNIKILSVISILIILYKYQHYYSYALPIVDCPSHSILNPCMSRCPITCSNYQNPPECLQVCQVGCECQPGFIKINKNPLSPCVKQYECQLYTNKRGQGSRPYPFYKRKFNITRQQTSESLDADNIIYDPIS